MLTGPGVMGMLKGVGEKMGDEEEENMVEFSIV